MKTPDFTPPAIAGLVILVLTNILILFGLDIGPDREAALEGLVNGGFLIAFLLHDAIVRHGRSRAFQYPPKPVEATTADDNVSA